MIQFKLMDANDFVLTAFIENTSYKLHFSWNSTSGQWYFGVADSTGKQLVSAIAIVPNMVLLNQSRRVTGLRGEFMAITNMPNSPANQKIGRKDFINGKFFFIYIPMEELAMIKRAEVVR